VTRYRLNEGSVLCFATTWKLGGLNLYSTIITKHPFLLN